MHIFGAHLSGASVSPFDIRNEGLSRLADWLASEEITILDINVATFRGETVDYVDPPQT